MVQSQEQLVEGRTGTLPDGTRVVVRNGQVVPLDGAAAAGFTPLGDGWFRGPDGSTYQEGRGGSMVKRSGPDGSASSGSPLVGADARARFMLGLEPLVSAQNNLNRMDAAGYNPSGLRNTAAAALEAIPFDGGYVARQAGGDDYNAYQQSVKTFEAAILPIMSGAAVTPSEAQRQVRATLPQPGDSPEVLRQKSIQREQMINAVAEGIGRERPFASQEELVGPTGPNGLPTYPTIMETAANIRDIKTPGEGLSVQWLTDNGVDTARFESDVDYAQAEMYRLGYQPINGEWVNKYGQSAPIDQAKAQIQEVKPFVTEQPISERTDPLSVGIRNVAAFGQAAAEQIPFMDEAVAYAASRLAGVDYDTARQVQNLQSEDDRRERPLARNLGGVAGFGASLALPIRGAGVLPKIAQIAPRVAGAGRVANAGRVLANTGRVMAGGAATGAVYGAGQGETIDERLGNAAEGGVIGAVAAPVVGAAGNALAQPVSRFIERVVSRPNALATGVDRFARRFKPDTNALAARADELESLGVQPALIDVVDDARLGTYRAFATRDTPARELAVRLAQDRRANLPTRVRAITQEEISGETRPMMQVQEELAATRRQNAQTGSQDFGSENVRLDENVATAMRSPVARSALTQAASVMEASLDPIERQSAEYVRRLASGEAGNGAFLTVSEVQDISKALNTAARSAFNSENPTAGPVLRNLASAIRNAGREQSEGYRNFLRQYADDMQLEEAATTGRNFVSVSADPVNARSTEAFVRGASTATPPEMQVYQAAAAQAAQAAGSRPSTARGVLEGFASDVDQQRRIAAIGADQGRVSARSAAELRQIENAQNISPRIGSQTGTNLADQAMEAGGALREAATGNMPSLMARAGRLIMSRGFSDKEAEALVQASIDPSRTREVIDMLSQRMNRQEARNLVRSLRYMAGQQAGNNAAGNDR